MPEQGAAPLVLASASPRRLALLAQAGRVPERVEAPEVDEAARPGELPPAYARRMARTKLGAVLPRCPGAFVLAADTAVASGRRILPKAGDSATARQCLGLLSGRAHRVWGAVEAAAPDGRRARRLVLTRVRFRRLGTEEVEDYLASGEWESKAGGYAVQGRAATFVARLAGSYENVVGLPLAETEMLLRGLGLPPAP